MTSKKAPINVEKSTRDRFNKFRDYHNITNITNAGKSTQDEFINVILDLYKEKYPELKKIIEGE